MELTIKSELTSQTSLSLHGIPQLNRSFYCLITGNLFLNTTRTVFLQIIGGGDHYLFTQKGGDYLRYCPKYFVLLLNQKMITPNKLNMGFLSVPNLVL